MGEVWTPRLRECDAAVKSAGYAALLQARLVELALGQDGKVAIEALKILVGAVGSDVHAPDPVLSVLPPEQLEAAYERAERFIFGVGGSGGEGGSGESGAGTSAEVFSALRFTDHAELPGGSASPADHASASDGGGGSD